MLKKQLYLQLISNLIIPVLGFWIWEWSLYFILLFYILDMISAQIVNHFKVKKIKSIEGNEESVLPTPTKTYAFISLLFLVLTIVIIHGSVLLLDPKMDLKTEFWNFLMYKEMGIPQGIILLPLVGLMAYTSYKIEFLLPKIYLNLNEKTLWKLRLKEQFVLISFSCILTFIAVAYQFPEWVILVIILVATTAYNYLQGIERIKERA